MSAHLINLCIVLPAISIAILLGQIFASCGDRDD
jgi:hypothetical protein